MKKHPFLFVIAGASLVVAAALYAAQVGKAAAKRAVVRAAEEMEWVDVPDSKGGEQQAVVWGNAEKGPHGAFVKFAAGTEVPWHTHTAAVRTAVISGTMVLGLEGERPEELGPGSYISIPGNVKHTTACKARADCLIYSEWSDAFDRNWTNLLVPVKP